MKNTASNDVDLLLSRRKLLLAAGLAGASTFGVESGAEASELNTSLKLSADRSMTQTYSFVSAPTVAGLHLQFGADASSEIVVSWHTLEPVLNPTVVLGRMDGKFEQRVVANTVSYTDAKSNKIVFAHHAKLNHLQAHTEYLYAAVHDNAAPEFGSFLTAPKGRAKITFTSFGDQGTPSLGKRFTPPGGVTLQNIPYVNDNLGSPAASHTTLGVERVQPLFHLFNGDLCYANLAQDRVRTWWDFWENNSRSARNRPWMPSPGNHENELGNGPIGYQAYQTYFSVPPASGQNDITRGLWYAFTAASVRVVSIANDDVVYQDSGNSYVRGYSNGAQKIWLENELAHAREDPNIDWVVVCMHQVAISTAYQSNGADLGIRENWVPLFDKYGVDLVVCGHEHHYERSHPIRGHENNATLSPVARGKDLKSIDTSKGTVHMVIGGGGTSAPTNGFFFNPPKCRVITAVRAPDPVSGKRASIYEIEEAAWSAVRNEAHAYGFASFEVDPGTKSSGLTTIKVTYFDVVGVDGQLRAFETFTLSRPRGDSSS